MLLLLLSQLTLFVSIVLYFLFFTNKTVLILFVKSPFLYEYFLLLYAFFISIEKCVIDVVLINFFELT